MNELEDKKMAKEKIDLGNVPRKLGVLKSGRTDEVEICVKEISYILESKKRSDLLKSRYPQFFNRLDSGYKVAKAFNDNIVIISKRKDLSHLILPITKIKSFIENKYPGWDSYPYTSGLHREVAYEKDVEKEFLRLARKKGLKKVYKVSRILSHSGGLVRIYFRD